MSAITTFWRATSLGWAGPRRTPRPVRPVSGPACPSASWRPPSLRSFDAAPDRHALDAIVLQVHGHHGGRRAIPSASGIYGFSLTLLDLDETTRPLFFHQIEGPATVAVLSADATPYLERYGARGMRYVLIEAGHYGQELLRHCAEAGLSTCPLGAFDDEGLAARLGDHAMPVYAVAIGRKVDAR